MLSGDGDGGGDAVDDLLDGPQSAKALVAALGTFDRADLERLAKDVAERVWAATPGRTEWQLLIRAMARHFAATDRSAWLSAEDLDEVALEEIYALCMRHASGDPLAGRRAEVLAWVVLHARTGWLDDLPLVVAETVAAAVVVGGEAPGTLGAVWRTAVGSTLLRLAARPEATAEATVALGSSLATYAQIAAREARSDGDADGLQMALHAIVAACRLETGDWRVRHEAASLSLELHHMTGAALTADAIEHARAATGLAGGDVHAALWCLNTLARALSAHAVFDEAQGVQDEAVATWRQVVARAQRLGSARGLLGARLNLASELGAAGAKRGDLAAIDEALTILDAWSAEDGDLVLEHAMSKANRLRARYDLTGEQAEIDAAIEWAEKAVDLASDAPSEVLSRALNNLGVKLRDRHRDLGGLEDIDRSVRVAHEALDLLPEGWHERPRWQTNLAHAYRQRAEVTGDSNDLREARGHLAAALAQTTPDTFDYWERINSHLVIETAAEDRTLQQLDALIELGDELLAADAPPTPRRHRVANVAALHATRAELLGDAGDARRALELWREALDGAAADSPDYLGLQTSRASAMVFLADVLAETALLSDAVDAHRAVIDVHRRRATAGPAAAVAWANFSNVLASDASARLDLSAVEEAVEAAGRALSITRTGARGMAALSALGNAHLTGIELASLIYGTVERARFAVCLGAYRDALALVSPDDPRYGLQAGNLANGLFQLGLLTRDLPLLDEAARAYEAATADEGSPGQAMRLTNLGSTALALAERTEDAEDRKARLAVGSRAFDDAAAMSPKDRLGVRFRIAVGRARVAALREDDGALIEAGETALALGIEGLRRSARSYRESHLRPAEALPALTAGAYRRSRGAGAAVGYLERSRSLLLRADLRASGGDAGAAGAMDADGVLDLAARCGEPIVYVLPESDASKLLVCSGGQVSTVPLRVNASEVTRSARALRRLSARREPAQRSALRTFVDDLLHDLGEWAGAPLAELLDQAGRVTLVPVGAFAALPWAAAMTPYGSSLRPLIAHGAVRVAASATLLRAALGQAATAGRPKRAVVVSNPARTDLPRLAQAAAEGVEVTALLRAAHLDVEHVDDGDATGEAVLDAARDRDVLHFACHAVERAMSSANALLLADVELGAAELGSVAGPARLAFLSACSTGQVELAVADEGLSLATSLLGAGVGSVVSTLWPADDETTREIATCFYTEWLAGASVAEALSRAQWAAARIEDDAPGREPFLWAGFAATGA